MEQKVNVSELRSALDQSWGLPTSFYYDPDIYELDLNTIFRTDWQYVGPSVHVSNPGDVLVGWAGNVPVVITRAEDGALHGFVNVCRHRGYRVAEKNTKNCKRLVCKYHAWSYWLNGGLAYAPGGSDDAAFPSDELSLIPVAVEEWGHGVYASADAQSPSFRDCYPGIDEAAAAIGYDHDPARYQFVRQCDHDVPSNWKLWFDNFVECYHCDNIHRSSFSSAYEASIDSVTTLFHSRFMISKFAPKEGRTKTELRANNYRSILMYPGRVLLQQDDLMILSQMRPLGVERVEQRVHYFAETGADSERVEAWIALWEQTFSEDGAATAIQQEGLNAGMLDRNRLLPAREEAVVYFNGLILDSYGRYLDNDPQQKLVAAE